MNDAQLTAMIIGLTGALRTRFPKIDGLIVPAVATTVGALVSALASPEAWRAALVHGVGVAIAAVGGMTAIRYAGAKCGEGLNGEDAVAPAAAGPSVAPVVAPGPLAPAVALPATVPAPTAPTAPAPAPVVAPAPTAALPALPVAPAPTAAVSAPAVAPALTAPVVPPPPPVSTPVVSAATPTPAAPAK